MIYVIMCGGEYIQWNPPKWLQVVNGEPIAGRTIRLLKEQGVNGIFISATDKRLKSLGVPVLEHDNPYTNTDTLHSYWCDAFYPSDRPTCYLFGDVVYSPEAIKTIIDFQTDDIMFFGSSEPAPEGSYKRWGEPYAFKVVDTAYFKACIHFTKALQDKGRFKRPPLAWELWQVIQNTPLNEIMPNYCTINDYTCDVDDMDDLNHMDNVLKEIEGIR